MTIIVSSQIVIRITRNGVNMKYREAQTSEMLRNVPTFKYDNILYNFPDPKVFKSFIEIEKHGRKFSLKLEICSSEMLLKNLALREIGIRPSCHTAVTESRYKSIC